MWSRRPVKAFLIPAALLQQARAGRRPALGSAVQARRPTRSRSARSGTASGSKRCARTAGVQSNPAGPTFGYGVIDEALIGQALQLLRRLMQAAGAGGHSVWSYTQTALPVL